MRVSVKTLVETAYSEIETISAQQAIALHNEGNALFVDIRDIRELEREGRIPGSFHAPRGMLEFWADPQSPYYNKAFATDKQLILYCAKGWRSALGTKTLQDMGVQHICHFDGGFTEWRDLDGPVESLPSKK